MQDVGYFVSVFLQGLGPTVQITLASIVLATVISFVSGLALLHRSIAVRFIVRVYVEGWRGTAEIIQLFWIYFVLPVLIGFQLVPLWAGIIVIALNTGAYGAEVVRGAVQSVAKAQYEACTALNLTRTQGMIRIILPQAVAEMIPSFNNLYISVLKGTALVSLINVHDITYQASQILGTSYPGQMALIYLMLFVIYLALSVIITAAMRVLERAAARMVGKNVKRTGSGGIRRALVTTGGTR